MDKQAYSRLALKIAEEAGQLLLEKRQTSVAQRYKGVRDIVTEADIAAQHLILTRIREHHPHDLIVAEEDHPANQTPDHYTDLFDQPTWVIDPLDGTSNYSRRLPMYAVSIGVAWAGQVQVAAVYLPVLDEMYTAVSQSGAQLNGTTLHIHQPHKLADAIIAADWGRFPEMRRRTMDNMTTLAHKAHTLRGIGSATAAICWIADGRLDLYLNYNMKVWDIAAAGLILQEAGGSISGLDGTAWHLRDVETWCVASNGRIHQDVLAQLTDFKSPAASCPR